MFNSLLFCQKIITRGAGASLERFIEKNYLNKKKIKDLLTNFLYIQIKLKRVNENVAFTDNQNYI